MTSPAARAHPPRPRPSDQMQRGLPSRAQEILRLVGLPDAPGRIPAWVVLPLRLFLGGTFVYAGLQKLTDPQFFSPSAPGFIGRQMSGFVHGGSPLTPLLTHLAIPHAAVFGALIAFCELWAGLAALLGLLTRLGALGGLAISLAFFYFPPSDHSGPSAPDIGSTGPTPTPLFSG